MENIVVVMENIVVVYFLDIENFGSRIIVGVDDTQAVVDKLDRVSFTFHTEDTVAMKNLSFVMMGKTVLPLVGRKGKNGARKKGVLDKAQLRYHEAQVSQCDHKQQWMVEVKRRRKHVEEENNK
ncbi:hypothetical protein Tco_0978222 [Tanacetum coccineum]|uniref:Uncharacterized protein n=1 Tax=Tanacetum coccineum TaxID=301880 RepID=A0ABQ5EMF4_9ASTR